LFQINETPELEAQWELALNSIESEGMPTQGNGQQVLALASHDKGDRFPFYHWSLRSLQSQQTRLALSKVSHGRKRHMSDL
jgi:hypothetical protein